MAFNLEASNNTGKLNMNDFLGDESAVQNDEKEIPINLLVPWENQPFKGNTAQRLCVYCAVRFFVRLYNEDNARLPPC